MSILIRKHHGVREFTGIGKLSLVGFISALANSFVITIWAVYLNSFINDTAKVGLISAFLTLVAVASYFIFIPFIEKSSKTKIYSFSLIIFGISYLLFAFIKSFALFMAVAIIINLTYALRITSFGLIIKDKSGKKRLPRNEGIIYTFANIAFIIGPLIAGYISSKSGNPMIFIITSILIFLTLIIFNFSNIKDDHELKKTHKNLFLNAFKFLKNKDRSIAYIIGSGPSFWWALIYLFIPLYIINNGLDKLWIGYFLFAVPIPLIFLEYKISNKVNKTGFRKLFTFGFLIASISALICFFLGNIYIILGVLILASIGLAMLEPTTEAYFFFVSNKKDEQRFYGPYNTRIELGGLAGKFIPGIILLFLPFKYIFIVFSAIMFLFFLISLISKNKAEKS
ncbi:MAG: MFS transporter [Candidatus Pacearchaeota archaeon]